MRQQTDFGYTQPTMVPGSHPSPDPVSAGIKVRPLWGNDRNVTIVYNGLLYRAGAQQVYLHTGYGPNWQSVYDHRMERTSEGWQCTINLTEDELHFCFKDSADNWDNNQGNNWCYRTGTIPH
ncbi:MAG: carbohydrate-binding protein [Heliobacteriaceae bacterium]|nr:carbohydrate-binding protein [Heliobacteriaceae bacterium]MDD4587807.1 carbohydrate-binding protein [Heliobacteriaceae bacterium]